MSQIHEQLLQVCEQLLTHSALPQDMLAKYYLLKKRKLSSQITLISSARKEHSNVDSMIFINKIINYVSHALNIILQSSSDKYIDDDLHLTIKLIEEYNTQLIQDDVMQLYNKIKQISSILRESTANQIQCQEDFDNHQNQFRKVKLEQSIIDQIKDQNTQLANIEQIEKTQKLQEEIVYYQDKLLKQEQANNVILVRVQKQSEDQHQKLKSQHKSNLDILQLNFDQMVQEARIKIDKYSKEREIEENNIFFSKFAESILPHLEKYEHEYTNVKQNKELNEKDILLDFVNYLLNNKLEANNYNDLAPDHFNNSNNKNDNFNNQDNHPTSSKKNSKVSSPQKYDMIRQEQPYPFQQERHTHQESQLSQSKDSQKLQTQSPQFHQNSIQKGPSPVKTKESNLDHLYKQLKDELEMSKQTLRDFEKSRTHLQSALKDSSSKKQH